MKVAALQYASSTNVAENPSRRCTNIGIDGVTTAMVACPGSEPCHIRWSRLCCRYSYCRTGIVVENYKNPNQSSIDYDYATVAVAAIRAA